MSDSGDADRAADRRPETDSKVGRVIADYDLQGLGQTLEHRWTRPGEERWSLRELADYFNRRVLETAMDDAGMSVLEGEVENTYRLLTGGDVSRGVQTEAETRLERNGIDVGSLREDFVSHQAVHTYLTKYRGVEQPTDETPQLERDVDTIGQLQNRTRAVAESILSKRRSADDVTIGEFDVLVDVRALCRDCGAQYDATTLLEAGGCDCEP